MKLNKKTVESSFDLEMENFQITILKIGFKIKTNC